MLEDLLCPDAARKRNFTMNAEEKIGWLNAHGGRRKWRAGDLVRCRLCGGTFKAESVAMDLVDEPTCPHCISSTTADFEPVKSL